MRKLGLSLGYGADEIQKMKCKVRWLSMKSARRVAFCLFQVIKQAIMSELAVIQAGARPDVFLSARGQKVVVFGTAYMKAYSYIRKGRS